MNISGQVSGEIVSTGVVALAGTFNVANATGFTPTSGHVYTVLQGTSVSNTCTGSLGTYTLTTTSTMITLQAA